MTEPSALLEAYHDLTEIDRRREGIRFAATLPDGMPVVAVAIAPEVGARITSHDRFAAEFQHAASVHHEALIPPVAWGSVSDGTLHCSYARPDSQNLVAGSLPPATVATLGAQVARGLGAIHQAGLVHGAITTARIIMARGRGAQLADSGLFAALSEGGLGPQAAVELLSPTPYTSPEVQLGNAPSARSDIYSLGASLYELLTGKPPYGGRMTSYVLAAVLSEDGAPTGEPPPPDSPLNSVVDALVRAIEQAPEDRWPSADAFAAALASGIPAAAGSSAAKSRRGCLPAAAAVLLTSGLIGVLVR